MKKYSKPLENSMNIDFQDIRFTILIIQIICVLVKSDAEL